MKQAQLILQLYSKFNSIDLNFYLKTNDLQTNRKGVAIPSNKYYLL